MEKGKNKEIGIIEMLSFGGAQFGASIFMAFTSYYLLMFCTDVAMIPSAIVGVLLIVYRIFCGLDTQAIGLMINRIRFKDGKFRPYLKWCALPFGICIAAIGLTPSVPSTIRIAYVAVVLFLCDLCWSALHTASMSMLPYLAKEDMNRAKIMSFSNSSSILAYVLIGTFTIPLIAFFGGGDMNRGFAVTLALLGAISVPLFLNAFFRLSERNYVETRNKPTLRAVLLAIVQNKRILLFVSGFCIYQIADSFKNMTTYHYVTHVLNRADMLPSIIFAGLLSPLAMQPVIPRLLAIAKKESLIVFSLFATVCSTFLILATGDNVFALMGCVILYGVFTSIVANLAFTVIASFSDEIRTGKEINLSEVLTASMNLSSNVGGAVAGGISAFSMAAFGYSAEAAAQTPAALTGIKVLYIVCTAVGMALSGTVIAVFRKKTQKAKTPAARRGEEVGARN